jgi:putative ABC transport system substrate-binding protein
MIQVIVDAARAFGVTVRDAPCRNQAEIEAVMAALARTGAGGLLALGDVFNQVHHEAIVALAAQYNIPTLVNSRQATERGGLMSYSLDFPELFRRSATYVDRILKGTSASDLPVQRPDKFWLAINQKTAKALGVKVGAPLLNTADEVLE